MLTKKQSSDEITKYTCNFDKLSLEDCQKLTEEGNPYGTFMLGYCYEHGIDVKKDEIKAFKYYQQSADMNDSNGIFQVGFCYYRGIGIEIDKRKAFEHYEKSAELNNPNGIFETAICYYYGIGVERDEDKFLEWLRKDPLYSSSYSGHDGGYIGRHRLRRILCRNLEYGKCAHCNEDNTSKAWCLTCDPSIAVQGWTSRNVNINDCIREFQFRTFEYENVIEWIPFDRLFDVKEIGKGGFGTVYSATWVDGLRKVNGNNYNYEAAREPHSIVALKKLPSSKETNFLKEFKSLMKCKLNFSKLAIYGITQNTETNEYLMVFQYANHGSLNNYLKKNFSELTWQTKLQILKDIADELDSVHGHAGYIHADLHSGNILQDQRTNEKMQSYIADLGLSRKKDECDSKEKIYGVMPYIAPEVLSGKQQFTQAADIYGFGIIMAEMSTGQRPFDEYEFDSDLTLKICSGERPKFASGTPECYKELANKCMSSEPQQRPKAKEIYNEVCDWLIKIASEDDIEIKKQFLNADKIIKTLPIILQKKHSDDKYISKLIHNQERLSATRDNMHTSKLNNAQEISSATGDSTLMYLQVSDITNLLYSAGALNLHKNSFIRNATLF